MGNSQATEQQGQMSYLAISPSPFVSIVKRPDHGLSDYISSSSNKNSRSAQDSVYRVGSTVEQAVAHRVEQTIASTVEQAVDHRVEQKIGIKLEQKPGKVKTLTTQETRQPDWIPQVICDHYSTGVSREQQRLTGCLGSDSFVCCNHDVREHPSRDLHSSGRRSRAEVTMSKADVSEVNTDSVHNSDVNTSSNCSDSLYNHHCTKISLQHHRTNIKCTDNSRHRDVNINEMNIQKVSAKLDDTTLQVKHYVIIQDTDRTWNNINGTAAKSKQDCSPSHQQHNNISKKNEMFHCTTDICGSSVKEDRISEANLSLSDVSEVKLVQCCLTQDNAEECVTGDFPCRQLSVTESCLQEVAEEDQGSGHGCLDSSKEEIQLVERGGSFDVQDHNGGDKKTAKGTHLQTQKGASVQQTKHSDSSNGHDGRLPRRITNPVVTRDHELDTNQVMCDSKFSSRTAVVSTSNDALNINHVNGTPSKQDLNSPRLGCGETSLTAAPNGHVSSGQLQAYSLSSGTSSICASRLQTAQVYVNPRTGEFHSLAFGSFTGEGTSLPACSRTVSQTLEWAPESKGFSINNTEVAFGTGSFSVSSQSHTDNPSCDFHPDDQLGVHVGRAGLFDSFRDSVPGCSLEHGTGRCKAEANQCAEETAQITKIQKEVIEQKHIPYTESSHSGGNSNVSFQTREAISNCESCITPTSVVPVFGSRSGSLCHMSTKHQQSLAQDTNSFSGNVSSQYRSQHSCDSWKDSLQKTGTTQTGNSCLVDYDSDNCEFSTSHTQQTQLTGCCNFDAAVANKDRGNISTDTEEVEPCETATENFGFSGKAKISPSIFTFGEKCLALCGNIIKSQRLAENSIRGTDTQEFDDSTVYSNVSSSTPSLNKHRRVAQAGMGCRSVRQQVSEYPGLADQVNTERRGKSSPGSKRWNCLTFTKSDKGEQLRPLGVDGSYQADNPDCPLDEASDTNSSDLDSSRRNRHQTNVRCTEPNSGKEHHQSEKNGVRQEREMTSGTEPCLLQIQPSRSLSCDCGDPFKPNYVAYLCCASEDLSSFGLAFHSTLESWGFRIFIAPRDLELTGPKYDNMARWLEDRCNGKIIVVLSNNYEKSDECLFLTYFARTLDPDSKNRNIIPVMIDKNVAIPNVLKGLSIIKYNYDFRCGWLRRKLINAIAA